ncbi:MAG: hypothetical protein ACRDQJ_07470 [Pseudonocardiaceae bacterium]
MGPFRVTAENTATVDPDGTVRLLTAILADSPRLPGAACRGRHRTYDPLPRVHQHQRQERARLAEATRICATCPARAQCPTVTTGPGVTAVSVGRRPAPIPPPPGVLPAA